MKAAYIRSHGGPEVLEIGEVAEPQPGPGEVKVRIRACALNRLDTYVRMGARGLKREFPPLHIPGGDASGDIADIGPNVDGLKSGDRVLINPWISCGSCNYCESGQDNLCFSGKMLGNQRNGCYAEYAVVPATNVFVIPSHLSYQEAAALPTVYLPVWNILVKQAQLKPSEHCLVLSASSGVGSAGIQVAKNVVGANCIATTSTEEKAELARTLGADHVILHEAPDFNEQIMEFTSGHGIDVVLDHVGARFYEPAFNSLHRGGRYGICGVTSGYKVELHMGRLFTQSLHVFGVYMGTKEDMQHIVEFASNRTIKGVVGSTYQLDDIAKAHEAMEAVNFFGKIIIEIP
jgi:NADPH:quinone reductase-like Zn-dependent oxidoreductase